MKINRRSALALLGSGLALPVEAHERRKSFIVFRHGVASGDPDSHGAILWTRATPVDPSSATDVPLKWRVAAAPDGKAVASGRATARAARDFTVKVEPRGLRAGRDYWFWFEAADGTRSPTGRFRTLPVAATPEAVLAVVSCQLYSGGLFNAYDAIAKLPRLDAVIHLGDYIYEYATNTYGRDTAAKLGRLAEPDREILTLDDYRRRHASYKRDPDLQAAHARAAFICVWDDHETANDSWVGGAENHEREEGDWASRKAAAMQAYFEWMPIRDPVRGKPWDAINRSFQFGDLASLLMVETRLLGRSRQVLYKGAAAEPADYQALLKERAQPSREMLGDEQKRWLDRELAASVKAGKPWQVLGNQVVMARVAGVDLRKALGAKRHAETMAAIPESYRTRLAAADISYRAGVPFNLDAWDGYPAARERLYASFRKAGSRPLVLSGDSHAFWANDLFDRSGALVAAEFGTSAITSPSYGNLLPKIGFGQLIADANDEVAYCDQNQKGFILLTLTPEFARGDYIAVSTVLEKPYTTRTIAAFETRASSRSRRLQRLR
jgi:alkaline phosphatase D